VHEDDEIVGIADDSPIRQAFGASRLTPMDSSTMKFPPRGCRVRSSPRP
jgi:hypothetical protein